MAIRYGNLSRWAWQPSLRPDQELVENLPDIAALVEPLLIVRRVLREQIGVLHRRLLAVVSDNEVCRRLKYPLSGVKRTCRLQCETSATDTKRT
ncbi:MAG TPA: hypothetical protein VI137_02075 [Pseudolabrys sp.]|jgi:hypothetical protein